MGEWGRGSEGNRGIWGPVGKGRKYGGKEVRGRKEEIGRKGEGEGRGKIVHHKRHKLR
jgi:hypothetical protein